MPKTYECQIEVLIQLQPLQSLPSSPPTENYLPPMRSLWNYTPNPKISSPPPLPPHPLPALPWGRTESNLHLPVVQNHVDSTDYSNRQWPSNQHDTSQDQGLKRKENTLEQQESVKKPKQETMTIRSITSTGTTDTYFHQSRRKKRDTKPPNANDIRPFIEVEKNKLGQYVLPAEVDSWTVLNLGTVVWDRAAFHNQRYIYPVGYCVKKYV
jgi:hypothetical protein